MKYIYILAIFTLTLTVMTLRVGAQISMDLSGPNGGALKIGESADACTPSIEGAVRYNPNATIISGIAPTSGLLSYWPMDEVSGSTAYDAVGGQDLTLTGGVTFQPTSGLIGGASETPGMNDEYMEAGDVYDFAGTANFTVSVWIKPKSFPVTFPRVIQKETSVPGDRDGWSMAIGDSSVYEFTCTRWVNDQQFNTGIYNDTLPTDVWVHLGCTYDGTRTRAWKNGVEVHSIADTRSLPDTSVNLTLGTTASNGAVPGINPNDAFYDEVRIYDRALDATEMQTLYDCALAGNCSEEIVPAIEYCDGDAWRIWGDR